MAREIQVGDIVGIYEILGLSKKTADGHKRLRVRCICCGVEKDARPEHLTATVCRHKRTIIPKPCKCCGNIIPYTDKTRPADYDKRIFCSSSCAAKVNNQREHSEESKLKASMTNLLHYHPDGGDILVIKAEARRQKAAKISIQNSSKYYSEDLVFGLDYVICPYCNLRYSQIQARHLKLHTKSFNDLYREFGTDYKIISDKSSDKKSKSSYLVQQKLLESGTHKGWQSRNITSYAERFWVNVLDNYSIIYEREAPVWHGSANYFLDFKLERNGKLIDLEIDGKQHAYEDRVESDKVRDAFLESNGYIVYRVPWNEISSEHGKVLMRQKINDFIEFYNSL
jgi:very-short-patch-repair endonuclease